MSGFRGLPALTVELGGTALSATELRSLSSIRVHQRLSLPTLCELIFVDPRGTLASQGVAPGTTLRVSTAAQVEPLFTGEVTGIEYAHAAGGPREVRVRGYDLLHRLRKRQPVREHVQVTLRDVARELVAELGLSVEAATPGPLWRQLIQHAAPRPHPLDAARTYLRRESWKAPTTTRSSARHLLLRKDGLSC